MPVILILVIWFSWSAWETFLLRMVLSLKIFFWSPLKDTQITEGFVAPLLVFMFMHQTKQLPLRPPLLVAKFEVGLSGSTEGVIQRIELPATVAPTPQTGNTNLIYPIERGKSEAMYLEKGYILCIGYLGNGPASVSGGLSASGVSIMAQGGFY
jgi:hypothetical protein